MSDDNEMDDEFAFTKVEVDDYSGHRGRQRPYHINSHRTNPAASA